MLELSGTPMTASYGERVKTKIIIYHGVSPKAKNSGGVRFGKDSGPPSLANLFSESFFDSQAPASRVTN